MAIASTERVHVASRGTSPKAAAAPRGRSRLLSEPIIRPRR